ncbi:MAG: hypothetical protein MUF07_06300 [Steroidobacteraceae bacterium]|nr:hypothetical protein [Steroidobacteraceae bacterium]
MSAAKRFVSACPHFFAKTPDSRRANSPSLTDDYVTRAGRLPLLRIQACMSYLHSLYDALVSINVPSGKAPAVVDAMERDMLTQLASKSDLENLRLAARTDVEHLRLAIEADIENLWLAVRSDIDAMGVRVDALRRELRLEQELLRSSMTIRLGSMLVVGLGVLFAALKLT